MIAVSDTFVNTFLMILTKKDCEIKTEERFLSTVTCLIHACSYSDFGNRGLNDDYLGGRMGGWLLFREAGNMQHIGLHTAWHYWGLVLKSCSLSSFLYTF